MSNQNLVPRTDKSGSIGVASKQWGSGSFATLDVTELGVSNINATGSFTGSFEGSSSGDFNGIFSGSASGSFEGAFDGDFTGDGSGLVNIVAVATGSIIGIQRIFDSGSRVEEYTSISGALSDSIYGDTVFVGAGTYQEGDLDVPRGVQLIGKTATSRDVIIDGNTVSNYVVKVFDDSQLAHMEIKGGDNENPIVILQGDDVDGAHAYIQDISVRAGNNPNQPGIYVTGSGFAFIDNTHFITTGNVLGDSILFEGSPNLSLYIRDVRASAKARSILKTTGSAGVIEIDDVSVEGNITAYEYGLDIDSNVSIQAKGLNWSNDVSSSVYFNENSDGCRVQAMASNIEGIQNDVLVHPSASGIGTVTSFASISFRTERYNDQTGGLFTTNANIDGLFIDRGVVEDAKVAVLGNLSVGTPFFPAISSFGEGQSQVNDILVLASGSTGFIDNTNSAISTGSVFKVFPEDSGSGARFYVGNRRRKFAGLRSLVSAPQINGEQAGIWEYSSGSEWVEFPVLHTDGEFPYYQWGQKVWPSGSTVSLQNTRFNGLLVEDETISGVNWTTGSVDGKDAYWVRYTLTENVSQSAEVTQLALHTNRARFGKDGFFEQFGQGQVRRKLQWHRNLEYSVLGQAPADSTINISPNVSYTFTNNTLRNTQKEGSGGIIAVPQGLDTARTLDVSISFLPSANAAVPTASVELDFFVSELMLGDTVDGTIPETHYSQSIEIYDTDALKLKQLQLQVSVPNIRPDEFFSLAYSRDASNNNPIDTYTGDVRILAVEVDGYFWN